MNYVDWYENFVGITVLAASKRGGESNEAEIIRRLQDILSSMEREGIKVPSGANLVETARTEYARVLVDTAKRYHDKITREFTGIDRQEAVRDRPTALRLRELFHNCYYFSFYCARLILVEHKMFDTTSHEKIDPLLLALAKRNPTLQDRIDRLVGALEFLRERRNKADYCVAERVIQLLVQEGTFLETNRLVVMLAHDSGVTP